jgi:RNA polymerase sigma-70 factor (ECF subfamily)
MKEIQRKSKSSAAPFGNENRPMGTDDFSGATDSGLVAAIGRWQQPALIEAYRRHAGAVFTVARRVLNDPARAEDTVQEVFVRLWNQPEKFDPERGSLRSYLLSQTHGRAVDILRSNTARQRREEREVASLAGAPYDLEDEVQDLVRAEQIRAAVVHLPENERRAIELAYFGGYTYREVARILEEPEGTVKTRIRSGLRRLRHGLNQAGMVGT